MSDLRQDPMTGQWVAISEVRATRPNEFRQVETRRSDIACAFCVGNESRTPDAVAVYNRKGNCVDEPDQDWLVRVVPNKFPAIYPAQIESATNFGPYESVIGSGRQEIIIQSPRHVASTSELNESELRTSFVAFQNRVKAMQSTDGVKHAMLFQNCRSEAGASLEHVHSQLIGTPLISEQLRVRVTRACDFHRRNGSSLLERVVQWEMDDASRIIVRDEQFIAFCPYASRFPYQIWVAPVQHEIGFGDCDDSMLNQLGKITQACIERLESVLSYPAYNILFHLAPFGDECSKFMRWYVEIVPRLNRIAGYELGTGCWINDTDPNTAADRLRNIPETPL